LAQGIVMRVAFLAVFALAACEPETPPAGSTGAGESAAVGRSAHVAAERECAELTGYAPEKLAAMTSEMQALVTREYKSCVAEVGVR